MRRHLPLLVALLATPALAAAQKADKTPAKEAVPPEVQQAIQKAVDKAKQELREEKAQDRAAPAKDDFFEGAPPLGESKKLNLLQISGYLRTRGDLFDNFTLKRAADPGGYELWPRTASGALAGTQTSANMRLRLEPTLNVSDQVRVLAQLDVLDDLVLGSSPERDQPFGVAPMSGAQGTTGDAIRVKRVWGEVQTPVGLLSFGRMPSQWGLGILAHAGGGLDDDRGDSVDRLQLAIPLRQTFLGPLVLVPHYDILRAGLVSQTQGGLGQPFDLGKSDDGFALGLKVLWVDTDDELRRKIDRGQSSFNFGIWYSYRNQAFDIAPGTGGTSGGTTIPPDPTPGTPRETHPIVVKRGASAHVLDLWGRYRTKRLRIEGEAVGIFGQIGDSRAVGDAAPTVSVTIRQLGASLQAELAVVDKFLTGLELGYASGDPASGIGNRPERGFPQPGSIDGAQWADGRLSNFRFNPAYRIDLVLWRELLGNVTDALYVRPTLKYEVLSGLSLRAGVVYSQTIYSHSSPNGTRKPLGVELDLGIHYASDDGFHLWLDWGVLQPFSGLDPHPGVSAPSPSRAHALRSGIAIKF